MATDRYHYATLSYDRLGIGMSSHGEPLDEIQASLEIAVLAELTMMLRNGSFPSLGQPFSKVIHVGHSFGSAQTYGLVSLDPTLSDGIVLTGFSMNASFVGLFFAGGKFVLANSISALAVYPNGYLAAPDTEAVYFNFFYPNYFDPALLVLAAATGEPVTVGELLTLGSAPLVNPYSGPVLVFTGGKPASTLLDTPLLGETKNDNQTTMCLIAGVTASPRAIQHSRQYQQQYRRTSPTSLLLSSRHTSSRTPATV